MQELILAGIPALTVRGIHAEPGEVALFALVVVKDSADDKAVANVVQAHVTSKTPSRVFSTVEVEKGLLKLENL